MDVSGHDAAAKTEGTGKLNYKLVVDNKNVEIGEIVGVTISPVNDIGIFARLQDCQVIYNEVSVSILNWDAKNNEINPVCDLTSAVQTGVSQNDLKFSWSAFKWTTQTDESLIEDQEISCEISLSKDKPAYTDDGCLTTQDATEPTTTVSTTTSPIFGSLLITIFDEQY